MTGSALLGDLHRIFRRDLEGLERLLRRYPDDAAVWAPAPGVTNVAGTLALHLAGNLQHFVGAVLGGSGYVRDREAEFARRDVPRDEIFRELAAAGAAVDSLLHLDPARLDETMPLPPGLPPVTVRRFLVHLVAHLGYHLGQADGHRRAVTGEVAGAGLLGLAGLGDPVS